MHLFSINGFTGSGKTHLANSIKRIGKEMGRPVYMVGNSTAIKKIAELITGVDADSLDLQEVKLENNPVMPCTNRELLIAIGEGIRSRIPSFWARAAMAQFNRMAVSWPSNAIVVKHDDRMPVEVLASKMNGFMTISVVRDDKVEKSVMKRWTDSSEFYAPFFEATSDIKMYNSIGANLDDQVRSLLSNPTFIKQVQPDDPIKVAAEISERNPGYQPELNQLNYFNFLQQIRSSNKSCDVDGIMMRVNQVLNDIESEN